MDTTIHKAQFAEIIEQLDSMMGYLELLAAEDLSPAQHNYVTNMRKASETLQHQLNDLQDLSQIGNGELPLEEIAYDIRTLIEETVQIQSLTSEKKQLELYNLINANVPEELIGDPGRIRQILNSLLENAIQRTDAGEILLEASAYRINDQQMGLLIRITDTGIGLTKEQTQVLFGPPSEALATTGLDEVNRLLGVTRSKGLIEQMQGDLNINSIPDYGTIIQFTIVQKKSTKIPNTLLPSQDILRDKCVMLVGESKTQQEIMRLYLSEAGMIVKQTAAPANALRALDRQFDGHLTADVIILDSRLHQTDVDSFPEHLRKQHAAKTPPVLLVTSTANKGDSKTARESGFSGYIPKPIRKRDLLSSLSLLFTQDSEKTMDPKPLVTRHSLSELRHASRDRILLADENKSNQKLVQMMLKRLGIDCDIAHNGREVLTALSRYGYQMIMLTSLTAGDEFQTVSAIRTLKKDLASIPIVAMLNSSSSGERESSLANGINDVLARPITMRSLHDVISRHVPQSVENR